MNKFELVSGYTDESLLPVRGTFDSAGYDFCVAEDIIIPSYDIQRNKLVAAGYAPQQGDMGETYLGYKESYDLDEVARLVKTTKAKPTLVPTGVKAKLDPETFLQLSVRSSCPLKYWLVLANGVGIIDADYYNNPDNEGHIYFQIINLSPFNIQLRKGDKIGQGIILHYDRTQDDKVATLRTGGFGSTSHT